MLERLRNHKWLIAGVSIAIVLSFLAGMTVSPTKTKTIYEDKIIYKDKIVEKLVYAENTKKDSAENKDLSKKTKRTRVKIQKPDGTVVSTTTVEDVVEDKTKKTQTEVVEKIVEKEVIKTVEVEKRVFQKVEVQKDWIVGVNLGTSATSITISPVPPYVSPIIVGIRGERRIFQGVYAGAWIQTASFQSLEGGITASFNF